MDFRLDSATLVTQVGVLSAGSAPPRGWGCTVALAGARLRLSRAYLAGGDRDDHDAADAGGVAAGFDFGDDARMAAEYAPVLGGAPAGQRRH